MPRNDPYRNFKFRVEIDGIQQGGFADATIPDTSTQSVDYREGIDPTHNRKLSGQTTYGNVSLKSGLTDSTELYDWRQQVIDTGALNARKSISLILVDEAGEEKTRWDVLEAWPTKLDASDFSAKGNDVIIETLDLVCEQVVRV